MDYVREAECYLQHYADLKKSVEHAQYMIRRLARKSGPGEIRTMRLDASGIAARRSNDTLQEMYELQKWQEVQAESRAEIAHIESLLEEMEAKERSVLQLWYVDKMNVADIAAELEYDERKSVYNLKSKALKKFSVVLFGILALKAI